MQTSPEASVGWVARSATHHAFVAMGSGLDGHNPSYALRTVIRNQE